MTLSVTFKRLALPPPSATAVARSSHALAIIDRTVILFGGEVQPRTPIDSNVLSIDLSSSSSPALNIHTRREVEEAWPEARVGTAMAALGRDVYMWGGRGGKDMSPLAGDLWKYSLGKDDTRGTWSKVETKGDRPTERSFHVMASLGGKIYVHAGCPASGRLSTLHSFDPNTATWRALASAPEPGRGGTTLVPLVDPSTHKELLLRYGGFAGHELGGSLDIYDVSTDSWHSISSPDEMSLDGSSLPSPRSVHAFVPLSRKLAAKEDTVVGFLFFGEREPTAKEVGHDGAGLFHADCWALIHSPKTKSGFHWLSVPYHENSEIPEPRGWFASGSFQDGNDSRVVFVGGLISNNQRIGEAWLVDLKELDG